MRTFTDLVDAAINYTGLTKNVAQNNQADINIIKQDINNGIKLFRHGARVAYTQKSSETLAVSGQQEYLLPPDCLRVTTVRGTMGNGSPWEVPVQEMISEEKWNQLNIVPNATYMNPIFFYIKGSDTLCLWPAPSDNTSQILITYEPKLPTLSVEDITSENNSYTNDHSHDIGGNPTNVLATATNGSDTVVFSEPIINVPNNSLYFEITDGFDGNTYKIESIVNPQTIRLHQIYQTPGLTSSGAKFRIGQSLDIPEEFQLAPAYYAAAQYFYKRKDNGQASMYDGMFQQLIETYKDSYGKKTTRRTHMQPNYGGFSPFFLTPGVIPGDIQ